MDKLVADLLAIEQSAISAMKEIEGEKSACAAQVQEEIKRRTLEIKRVADKELQLQKQKVEQSTQAELDAIASQSNENAAKLKELFATNSDTWRKKWLARILNQES